MFLDGREQMKSAHSLANKVHVSLFVDGIAYHVFSDFLTYLSTSGTHCHGCSLCFVSALKITDVTRACVSRCPLHP